jgi:hypothetical protein
MSWSQPPQISVATDIDALRNFREGQQFWAFGQTVQAQFHITHKDAVYCWLSYYTNGKFKNSATATAKLPATTPQEIVYTNQSSMGLRQFSLGWKRYFKGTYDIESGWSLYGYGGFGLMSGKIVNTHSPVIDSADYNVPVKNGNGSFKRPITQVSTCS